MTTDLRATSTTASPAQPARLDDGEISAAAPVLQLNPQARVRFFHIGRSKTPLLVIDDAVLDVNSWCEYAAGLAFQKADAWYPGVRAALPASYYQPLLQALAPLVSQLVFALSPQPQATPQPLRLQLLQAVYSLISTAPADLDLLQRLPHVDSVSEQRLALVHYLAPEPHGGTVFYQHLPTGIERVTAQTEPRYLAACQDYLQRHGVPSGYPQATSGHAMAGQPSPGQAASGHGSQYQVLQKVHYQQNRLLVYPGALLHAAEVLPQDILADVQHGRLTANLFFDWALEKSTR